MRRRQIGRIGGFAAILLLTAGCSATVDGTGSVTTYRVTCASVRSSADAGNNAGDDAAALRARAARLGDRRATVRADGDRVVVSISAVAKREARGLCASGTLDFRGLAAPAVQLKCGGSPCPTSPDEALAAITLPAASRVYASDGIKGATGRLADALSTLDCAAATRTQPARTAYRVACSTATPVVSYLLGPAVLPAGGVVSATATAPTSNVPDWTVTVRLNPAARRAWAEYTGAHNVGGQGVDGDPTMCSNAMLPCPTFVAFVYNGRVVSAPLTQQRIDAQDTQVAGNFTRKSATSLARTLANGSLAVPLRLVSVRRV